MTAGSWHELSKDLSDGAWNARPAVTVACPLGRGPEAREVWVDMFDGPTGRKAVAVPDGALDREALYLLADALGQAQQCGVGHVTLDFTRVPHLDYRAIPGFVSRLQRWSDEGTQYSLVGLNPYCSEIFRAAGVELVSLFGDDDAVCGAAASAGAHPPAITVEPAPPRSERSTRAEDEE